MALNNADLAKLKQVMKELWQKRITIHGEILSIKDRLADIEELNNSLMVDIMTIKGAIDD